MSSDENDSSITQCKKALIIIEDAIDSINALKYANLDKPELWGVTDPALDRLRTLDRQLNEVLNKHRQSLYDSALKRLARAILTKLTSSKQESGVSPQAAKNEEQRIMARFNLESDKIMRAHQASHQYQSSSSVPTSSRAPAPSAPMSYKTQSKAYSGSRGNQNDRPSSTNRIYEGSSGFTSREPRGSYTDSQQNYYSSQRRVQGNYDEESITNDPPPPYRSVRSSQGHQSGGSVSSSQWDRNSGFESVRSDVVARGSHRSTPSGGSYDPRGAELSRGARVSSDGPRFSEEYYSSEATYGSVDDPNFIEEEEEGVPFDHFNPQNQSARQSRRGEYPPGPAASGNSGYRYGAH